MARAPRPAPAPRSMRKSSVAFPTPGRSGADELRTSPLATTTLSTTRDVVNHSSRPAQPLKRPSRARSTLSEASISAVVLIATSVTVATIRSATGDAAGIATQIEAPVAIAATPSHRAAETSARGPFGAGSDSLSQERSGAGGVLTTAPV
jgi:hypothetical protein